jgi:hypothetical protein
MSNEPEIKQEGNGIHINFKGNVEESRPGIDVSGKNQGMMSVNTHTGEATLHGPQEVRNTNSPNPDTPLDTIQTTWGSPVHDVKEALKPENLDKYTIQVGPNSRCSIRAAVAAGIYQITPEGNLSFADHDRHNVAHQQSEYNEGQFMSPQTLGHVRELRNRMGSNADSAIMQVVAHGGKESLDDKAAAAIDRFASDASAPDREAAINFVNGLVEDVFQHAEGAIASRYNNVDPHEVTEFIMKECQPEVKQAIFISLYHGRTNTLNEMVERYKLNNKS